MSSRHHSVYIVVHQIFCVCDIKIGTAVLNISVQHSSQKHSLKHTTYIYMFHMCVNTYEVFSSCCALRKRPILYLNVYIFTMWVTAGAKALRFSVENNCIFTKMIQELSGNSECAYNMLVRGVNVSHYLLFLYMFYAIWEICYTSIRRVYIRCPKDEFGRWRN